MISSATRGPVIINALKRNKSPKKTPMKPEVSNQTHPIVGTSTGKVVPKVYGTPN